MGAGSGVKSISERSRSLGEVEIRPCFVKVTVARYAGFFIATTSALIVGKSVLVANTMPFLRRFDNSPLVYPILFKTFVYTLFVFLARLIEALAHYLVQGGVLGGGRFIEHLTGTFS
jgi:hypothetical protein